jgi:acyl-homoserine-lactone acylase
VQVSARLVATVAGVVAGVVALIALGVSLVFVPLVREQTRNSIDPPAGQLPLAGLAAPVSIRRDAYGVPLIEAQNQDDLAFAAGYAMAQDRLNQMVGMTLAAQGRLAELAGPVALPMDRYMRTLGVRRIAAQHFRQVPPELLRALEKFSAGVNAYVDAHRTRLPMSLRLADYQPEAWTPLNSMDIYMLLNLGLALNLHQEVDFLNLAAKVGPEKAAWLLPTMPDEPLPFEEARKLFPDNFAALRNDATALVSLNEQLRALLLPTGIAASNNWVVAPQRSAGGASILANDTHLMLEHPPLWMLMQLRAPGYNATGIAVAGVPGIVAGYNGHIAWGMTMVMADGQDLFVERLRQNGAVEEYLAGDAWVPVQVRDEVLKAKGGHQETLRVRSTRHGPLMESALREPQLNPLMPVPQDSQSTSGLALSWTASEPDNSMAALWAVARAQTIAEAQAAIRDIRYIHLNVVFADRNNIGWQVTGRYPKRKAGSGKFPSPGWSGDYDWQGWWDVAYHPAEVNPEKGFFGTANDRKVPANYPLVMSSSWFYPERGERIDQLLAARNNHTAQTSVAMQADQVNLFGMKLRRVLLTDPFAAQLKKSISALPAEDGLFALEALAALGGWDGNMQASSKNALIFALFQDALPRAAFLDELGPETTSPAWRALSGGTLLAYSATQDHLLQRADSPFWDDVGTETVHETKADIVARALAESIRQAEERLGDDRAQWQWGKVHTYTWRSPASAMRAHLPAIEQYLVGLLAPYADRGPFAAGDDHNTLNVSGSQVGSGKFDVETVPAMRLVVDFSLAEPVQLVIAGGQSDDPASAHYADGIPLYLSLKNRVMAFNDVQARHAQYKDVLVLQPALNAAVAVPATPPAP